MDNYKYYIKISSIYDGIPSLSYTKGCDKLPEGIKLEVYKWKEKKQKFIPIRAVKLKTRKKNK
jgi:hypothetical protein